MRVGVLCYSTGNRVIFHLHDHDGDLTQALQDVHDIVYKGGGTYIGSAIKSVRENMYLSSNGDRADVENIMILMTDGQSSGHDPYQQVQEAELSKQAGITIATVGIGNNVDDVTLRTLASSNELYLQTDFDNLQRTFEILIESLGSCPSGT
ncbi:hypothetical protein FSP39_015407 [Pinctada imbricata]|uniref:VWFA domain-containing protein n=1 Tax=Pinctada imbricata TaxID=66713 RepID=A0AA89BSW8_PINIB|nr:hypothetical protein FSP39_015407 [Pinctada imbricata]